MMRLIGSGRVVPVTTSRSDTADQDSAPVTYAVHYQLSPGARPAALAALRSMAPLVQDHEPGCLIYQVNIDPADEDALFLYEVYADDAAYEHHCATPYFQQYVVGTVRPLVTERTATRYRQAIG